MTNLENKNTKTNIFNFEGGDSFFFQVTKISSILPDIRPNINLDISNEDVDILTKEISDIKETIEKKEIIEKIQIIPFYFEKFINLEEKEMNKSVYSERISNIIKEYSGERRLTLKLISSIYHDNFSESISPMTVSRVL